jgi:dTDP-4-dehydrorhamnose reductase
VAKVAILGSTGMLGSCLTKFLESEVDELHEFNRSGTSITGRNKSSKFHIFEGIDLVDIFNEFKFDYIVNATSFNSKNLKQTNDYIESILIVNKYFLNELNNYSKKFKVPIIQISTDGVFSGKRGFYIESDLNDSNEMYGKSKLEGEKLGDVMMILRCSMIGKELTSCNSLLEWVLQQPKNAQISGYINHRWNGITTLHMSKIILGIIKFDGFKRGVYHVVPENSVNKNQLISIILNEFNRLDVNVKSVNAPININRVLATMYPENNLKLWSNAGYANLPYIEQMVKEFAEWSRNVET